MRERNKLLVLTAGFAGCYLVATVFHAPTQVLTVFAFALLASLGYVWIEVILQGRAPTMELVSVAVGLVLAVPVLGGVVLQEAGFPLTRVTWSCFLVGLTIVGDIVLVFRSRTRRQKDIQEYTDLMQRQDRRVTIQPRLRAPRESVSGLSQEPVRRMPPSPEGGAGSRWNISPWRAVACSLAALIAGGAIWVAQVGAASQQYPGFTELWLSGTSHSTSIDNLGVSNHEGRTETYRLVLLRKGHAKARWNLTLAAGQTWQRPVRVTVGTKANLYLSPDMSQPYRYVDTGS